MGSNRMFVWWLTHCWLSGLPLSSPQKHCQERNRGTEWVIKRTGFRTPLSTQVCSVVTFCSLCGASWRSAAAAKTLCESVFVWKSALHDMMKGHAVCQQRKLCPCNRGEGWGGLLFIFTLCSFDFFFFAVFFVCLCFWDSVSLQCHDWLRICYVAEALDSQSDTRVVE